MLNPFMGWAYAHLAEPRALAVTLACLDRCIAEGRPLMLLGGLVQLHALTRAVGERRRGPAGPACGAAGWRPAAASRSCIPSARRASARTCGQLSRAPVTDVYGMAEANWAAFECAAGNHHIPPWVYAVVTDDDDRIVDGPDATGCWPSSIPVGGGDLIPPFFQTADRVRLVNGAGKMIRLACPCGREGHTSPAASERVDLVEEAGCAAQV